MPSTAQPPMTSATRTSGHSDPFAGRHVYMIGIGGCGMSGLARMLRTRAASVAGSDKESSDVTAALAREGIAVGFDQSKREIPETADLIIASAAVRAEHPQVMAAKDRGLPVLLYAEALGMSMIGRTGVAIAGTHGKSTTTAMLGATLTDCGLDPTVIVGAICRQLRRGSLAGANDEPGGFRLGGEKIPAGPMAGRPGLLLAEACEFNRSFHNLRPVIGSISSVEADHLDIYGTLDAVVESFHQFAKRIAPASNGGRLLIAHDGAHRREVTAGLDCAIETIGYTPDADWIISYDPRTRQTTLTHDRERVAEWVSPIPGAHNATNAATAMALATMLGADPATAARSLQAFRGVDRRMHFLGEKTHTRGGTVRVYDDYGHHPTEIDATLRALREFERPEDRGGRLICVFQPHQHSRTRFLMEEFANSFSQADIVIVPHIYFVRDTNAEKQLVSAGDLVDRLREKGVRAMHLYPFEAIVEQLETLCRPNDLVVAMGAGPVWQVARGYLDAKSR